MAAFLHVKISSKERASVELPQSFNKILKPKFKYILKMEYLKKRKYIE
ncbi:hypothetical protein LEP1GSC062_2495 [Leptospira alexanderi serovar Manhao 3 str. L 60]|uniref:Uncharacterized protein n=1 Tax=Leptospira alexanderi serovar Manhao 3 str. L 60 TaxID=1049759 RepID=V6I8Q7_9LEPT|nr:hypothetical protein LEP1GSC062_2495 [Leptospira alexanderi serovar Manhao 3 str. L 60]